MEKSLAISKLEDLLKKFSFFKELEQIPVDRLNEDQLTKSLKSSKQRSDNQTSEQSGFPSNESERPVQSSGEGAA